MCQNPARQSRTHGARTDANKPFANAPGEAYTTRLRKGNLDEMSDTTRDSNGTELHDGDNVTVIKDLKVKGTSSTIKRGTLVKGIRLTGNPDEVECRVDKIKGLVLRTEFLKKA
jgi:protein PhnA